MTHSLPYTIAYYTLMLAFSPAWAVFHFLGFTGLVAQVLSGFTTIIAVVDLYWYRRGRRRKLGMAVWIALGIMLVVGNICAYTFGGYG